MLQPGASGQSAQEQVNDGSPQLGRLSLNGLISGGASLCTTGGRVFACTSSSVEGAIRHCNTSRWRASSCLGRYSRAEAAQKVGASGEEAGWDAGKAGAVARQHAIHHVKIIVDGSCHQRVLGVFLPHLDHPALLCFHLPLSVLHVPCS